MKGVILAAGYGSRFLPATKTIPKEMFPLIDTPVIDLIVREMVEAGIKDILIVSSRRKKALEDYFDREVELEVSLKPEKKGLIRPAEANLFFMRQQTMAGTGDALLLVAPFVGESPFVVAYPDDVMLEGRSLSGELMELHEKTGKTVLAGREIPAGDISRYGVMALESREGVEHVTQMVEKPPTGQEPSRMVGFGRYLYTPEIFEALRASRGNCPPGEEFTQTEALNHLAGKGRVVNARFTGTLMDVGTPEGYLEAVVEYGLKRPEFREKFLAFLKEKVST